MKTSAIVSLKEFSKGQQNLKQSIVAGDYRQPFLLAGILCLLAGVSLILLKSPETGQAEK
jgi:hypothetical protein